DRAGASIAVEEGATAGDFLSGFLQGTRRALYENDRESITITIPQLGARAVGILIALYERAVGFYASLININAYHQPGVEAGKKAAAGILDLQRRIFAALGSVPRTSQDIARAINAGDETVFDILQHLSATGRARRTGSQEPGCMLFAKA